MLVGRFGLPVEVKDVEISVDSVVLRGVVDLAVVGGVGGVVAVGMVGGVGGGVNVVAVMVLVSGSGELVKSTAIM